MEKDNHPMELLEAITCPSFCVQDRTIVYTNEAARLLQIETESDVTDLLASGKQEYADFSDGCLCLSVCVAQNIYEASVYRVGQFHIFRLEQEEYNQELKALTLASRELREPLASMMSAAERLFSSEAVQTGTETAQQLAWFNRSLYQMLRIVSNMSDTARYERSGPAGEIMDIASVMDEVMEKAAALVDSTGVTLNYQGINKPVFTRLNREKIERAVYNLLSNAIKFSPPAGAVDVMLKTNGSLIYIIVSDMGPGIPSAMRSTVFSRFLREPGIEDGRHGIGLGMALVRAAAATHGGTVLLESSEDKGLRVTMTLKISTDNQNILRSNSPKIDYLGERDHALVELSGCLPASAYQNID